MATLFPFNQLPKVPNLILEQFVPLLMEQQSKLTELADSLITDNDNLLPNVSCNDAQISEIKNKLQEAQQLIQNLTDLLNFIPSIINSLNTIKTIGTVIGTIQLAIPAVLGLPNGPITQLLNSAAELIENIEACVAKLQTVIELSQSDFNNIGNAIAKSDNTLENICNEAVSGISSSGLSDQDILDQYPSEFYQIKNVSDPDIQARLQLIKQLIDEQIDVVTNINEAPSQVLVQSGQPQNNIGQLGDYWIDQNTQQVYGPKPSDTSWS